MRNPNIPKKERSAQRGSLNRAMKYLGHYRQQALIPYLFMVVATLAMLVVPSLVSRIINAVTKGVVAGYALDALAKIPNQFMSVALPKILGAVGQPASWTQDQLTSFLNQQKSNAPRDLLISGGLIVLFAVVRAAFAFLQNFTAERNSQSVAFDLRNDLFAKLQRLSFSYHDRNQTGQLMVRATDDVEKVRLFLGQGLLQLLSAILLLTGTLVILFSTNVNLALISLPIMPVAIILFMIFNRFASPLFTKVQVKLSNLNTVLQENLAGIKVIKAFTREKSEQVRFTNSAEVLMDQQITVSRLFSFLMPLIFLTANFGQAAVLYFGGRQIINGTLNIGQWQEFSLYLIYLFMPIMQFGFIITQMSQASASATRIFAILDAENEVTDKPEAYALPEVQGDVRFNDVTFRYFNSGEPVLQNVSFEAKPGETVALLGATGSGKTTIINLLPRFYDPSEGAITIDGHDLREVTLDSLRKQIGIVLQETTLFGGSIRDNIAFGKPDATLEQVMDAAKAAAAHDFILSFPTGYDTPVGERGTTLSGGQKQRIAIARALLLNPRILILDDSTSSVDLATELQIQKALDELMRGRTSFVIAQRISTVMNADQILVLDKGGIVAQGKHADLMEDSAIYAEIYNSQLVEDSVVSGTLVPEMDGA